MDSKLGACLSALGFLCITAIVCLVICRAIGFNSGDAKEVVLLGIGTIGGAMAGGSAVYAYMKPKGTPEPTRSEGEVNGE